MDLTTLLGGLASLGVAAIGLALYLLRRRDDRSAPAERERIADEFTALYSAEYLDACTLFDLDLFVRKTNELNERRGPRMF